VEGRDLWCMTSVVYMRHDFGDCGAWNYLRRVDDDFGSLELRQELDWEVHGTCQRDSRGSGKCFVGQGNRHRVADRQGCVCIRAGNLSPITALRIDVYRMGRRF